jgi:hypothetical protein
MPQFAPEIDRPCQGPTLCGVSVTVHYSCYQLSFPGHVRVAPAYLTGMFLDLIDGLGGLLVIKMPNRKLIKLFLPLPKSIHHKGPTTAISSPWW